MQNLKSISVFLKEIIVSLCRFLKTEVMDQKCLPETEHVPCIEMKINNPVRVSSCLMAMMRRRQVKIKVKKCVSSCLHMRCHIVDGKEQRAYG